LNPLAVHVLHQTLKQIRLILAREDGSSVFGVKVYSDSIPYQNERVYWCLEGQKKASK